MKKLSTMAVLFLVFCGFLSAQEVSVSVETAADGSGVVVTAQSLASGSPLTVYAISRDGSNAFVANVAATWSLVNKTGGVVDGDLVAAGDFKSATLTGLLVGSAEIAASYNLLPENHSGTITVVPGALHHFALSSIASQTAGTPFTFDITAQDAANNTDTSFVSTATITSTGTLTAGGTTAAFTSGVLTGHSVTISNTGNFTVTATASAKSGTSNSFTVAAGALHHFAIGAISTQEINNPFNISVTAQDASNNTVTSFGGTVSLTTNNGTIAPTTSNTFTSGTLTESITLTISNTAKTVTVDDGSGHTGTSNAFAVRVVGVTASTGTTFGAYMTLKAAFDAINLGTHTGAIIIRVDSSTTETATAQLFASGMGSVNYTSVRIYPTVSGVTVAGNLGTDTLIACIGADNVTIDGRVNRTGTTRDLTLQNTAAAASGNFVVVYTGDATYDTLMYCTVKSQNTGTTTTTYGLVYFGIQGSYGGGSNTGNDNNVVDNCDIDGQGNSTILVASVGTSGTTSNSGITISNNLIHDFYLGNTSTQGTGGLRMGAGNDANTVTGNSFYQTSSRAYVASTVSHNMIELNVTTGNGFVITKNYLGGTAPYCGGTPLTVTGGAFRYLGVVSLSVGSTTPTRVDSNVIRNFDITSAFTTAGSGIFLGFYVSSGTVNFTRDTVGASTGTNSVKVTATANTAGLLVGFNMAAAYNTNVTGCVAGSLTGVATGTNVVHVYGINNDKTGAAGILTVDGCLIGSRTTANSIQSNMAVNSPTQYNVHGIRLASGTSNDLTAVVKNTVVANLATVGSGTGGQIVGILCAQPGTAGRINSYVIKNDSIYNLTNSVANPGTTGSASVNGILHSGTSTSPADTVSNNVCYNFSNTSSANIAVQVYGIQFTGAVTKVMVSKNMIHSGSIAATSTAATLTGIRTSQGTKYFSNNIVSLGSNVTSINPIINAMSQAGGINYYFYNTFRVSGTNCSDGPNGPGRTYAYNRTSISSNDSLFNNIFYNERTNKPGPAADSGSGIHYAALFSGGSFSVVQNYNLFYSAYSSSKFLARVGSGDSSNFSNFLGAITSVSLPAGHDANSLNAALNFVSATDSHIDNTQGSYANNTGYVRGAWVQDYDGTTRSATTPDIGADEFTVNPTVTTTSTLSGGNYDGLTINGGGITPTLSGSTTVAGTLTLTNGDLDLNGQTLTLGSSATLSETAGNTVKGTGSVTTTRALNAPSAVDVAGMGAVITSAANLGSTVVTRTHVAQNGNGNNGILRTYEIAPSNNTGLSATLRFKYDESELNSIPEANLFLYKSTDNGTTWNPQSGATLDQGNNYIELTGINDFSKWTLGNSAAPLPVEMTSFTASMVNASSAVLQWHTATELNNLGFEIERRGMQESGVGSQNSAQWIKVGFVSGAGTSNSPKDYTYQDANLAPGVYVYRLKQIDIDGAFRYSASTQVDAGISKSFELLSNYPNPFNPETNIRFSVPENGYATLKVFNMLGQEVAILFSGMAQAGHYIPVTFNAGRLASGVYFSRLEFNGKSLVQRMLMTK